MIEVAGGVLIAAFICGVFILALRMAVEGANKSGVALMVVALMVGLLVVMAGDDRDRLALSAETLAPPSGGVFFGADAPV